jgi:alkylated DNA repair dioxygenase AlkB
MLDMFNVPIIPGLEIRGDLLSVEEERALIAEIDMQDMTPFRFQQWTGKRLTHSFGWKYDFQSGEISRSDPMPNWLLSIRERAAAFAGFLAQDIVQALLIRYDPGAGIGWHKDRPIYEHVIGISLGAPAAMRFRRKRGERWERATAPLDPRSIYHLSGEVRSDWEHSIVEMDRTRYSITFRSFSATGRRLAERA